MEEILKVQVKARSVEIQPHLFNTQKANAAPVDLFGENFHRGVDVFCVDSNITASIIEGSFSELVELPDNIHPIVTIVFIAAYPKLIDSSNQKKTTIISEC